MSAADVALALLGVLGAIVAAVVRTLWRLSDRIARLEGRLNGEQHHE